MKAVLLVLVCGTFMNFNNNTSTNSIIANGQMPNIIKDKTGMLHLVYGTGDSIMYLSSIDGGRSFSNPALISVLPKLAASHTRGPQIVATDKGLLLTACTKQGNIFSFIKSKSGNWKSTGRINDRDTVAKENLMALSADGQNAFAVWLDLRDGHNKIYGAGSSDGGKTWSKNIMVYASPDKTVCECCKPSVVMNGNHVYVMFRNWLNGNRDMYLTRSSNGGRGFTKAEKLGLASWALNGCPMDGGGLALNNGNPVTLWNRSGVIYVCEPGKEERALGKGRGCTLKIINQKNVYAWLQDGELVLMNTQGKKTVLGKGNQPVLEQVNDKQLICVWENEKQIHASVLEL